MQDAAADLALTHTSNPAPAAQIHIIRTLKRHLLSLVSPMGMVLVRVPSQLLRTATNSTQDPLQC